MMIKYTWDKLGISYPCENLWSKTTLFLYREFYPAHDIDGKYEDKLIGCWKPNTGNFVHTELSIPGGL